MATKKTKAPATTAPVPQSRADCAAQIKVLGDTRWATADIDYVREQSAKSTVRQIAEELGEPLDRVRGLVYRLKKGGTAVRSRKHRRANAVQIVSLAHGGVSGAAGGISACTDVKNAPETVLSAPPDLLQFVASQTVSVVATALSMSRKTAWRLSKGEWPKDTRKVLAAWAAYKGRSADRQSGWFLRRVQQGGTVLHAGQVWSAQTLALRTGQTLAVARCSAGELVAQTLDLPSVRMLLVPLEG